MVKFAIRMGCAITLQLWTCSPAGAALSAYSIVLIDTATSHDNDAVDANGRGQATGFMPTPYGTASHAYLHEQGADTDLGTLGGAVSVGQEIGRAHV